VCVLAGAAGNIGRWIGIGYLKGESGIGYWVSGIGGGDGGIGIIVGLFV